MRGGRNGIKLFDQCLRGARRKEDTPIAYHPTERRGEGVDYFRKDRKTM